jgi:uncharacterized protein (DUF362 family)
MFHHRVHSRRSFLAGCAKTAAAGIALHTPAIALARQALADTHTPVTLTSGASRGDNVLAALKPLEKEIRNSLKGKHRVVIKPNMVLTNNQLAATHADCVEAILDYMSTLYKGEFIVMDSPASGSVMQAFENYDYYKLAKKYRVRFLDLDEEPTIERFAVDHQLRPHQLRMSKLLWDRDTYIVSAAIPKTHDRAIITLSLKNVVVGAAKKDRGFRWDGKGTGSNDKRYIHGGKENAGIHYNLFELGRHLHPHLSVIDGFKGMEGNGPCGGDPVNHRICVASVDWLAADRVTTELMGFDFEKVGYLKFAADAGLGQADLDKIEIVGPEIARHARQYKPHQDIEQQYRWMTRSMAG